MTFRQIVATRRWLAPVAALAMSVTLAGCDTVPYPELASGRGREEWRDIPLDKARVTFREPSVAPKVLAVKEKYSDSGLLTQQLTLENATALPGENFVLLNISYNGTAAPAFSSGTIFAGRYNDTYIKDALDEQFGDLAPDMDISTTTNFNRYGPYAYASYSHYGEPACVFAWQTITDRDRILPDTINAIAVEYRYCGPAASPERLLAPFNDLYFPFEAGVLPGFEEYPLTNEELARQYESSLRGYRPETETGGRIRPVIGGSVMPGRMAVDPGMSSGAGSAIDRAKSGFGREPTQRLLSLSSRNDAQLVQSRLSMVGVYSGPVDGDWGPSSQGALTAFKLQQGMPDTGWDIATQQALFSAR